MIRSWSLTWRIAFAIVVGLTAFAAVYGPAVDQSPSDDSRTVRLLMLMVVDALAFPFAVVLLAWRRRFAVAVVIIALSAISTLSVGAGVLAVVSLTAAQPVRRIVVVGAAFIALSVPTLLVLPDPEIRWWAEALGAAVAYALLALIGLYLRSRRQLVASLRAQAQSTQREQLALRHTARAAERARIAREMHDALGHQLSVIAMHAGALESRADLSVDDTRAAAGVLRETAHEAMNELRQVLGVLNHPASTREEGTDVPTLAQLEELVATGVGGDTTPHLRWETDPSTVPDTVSRHLYRIAQEALTNVRKHAPAQPTEVVIRSTSPDVVELEVRNQLATPTVPPPTPQVPPGLAHHGLTGLAERARLVGGSITAGPDDTHFVVRAVLPCPR